MEQGTQRAKFRRIGVDELNRWLGQGGRPLILDIRRGAAFEEHPGIQTAVPLALDSDPIRLPDLPRDHPVVTYCL